MRGEKTVFEISQWIKASPEVIFDYFVDPRKLVEWMGLSAELEAVPDGEWLIRFDGGVQTWGRFLEIEPPERLVFTWGCRALEGRPGAGMPGWTDPDDSRVEITLHRKGDRTRLDLRHTGFAPEEPAAQGWAHFLERLAEVLERRRGQHAG